MAAEQALTRHRLRSRWGTVRVRTTLVATAAVGLALLAGSVVLVSVLSSMLTDSVRASAQAQATRSQQLSVNLGRRDWTCPMTTIASSRYWTATTRWSPPVRNRSARNGW